MKEVCIPINNIAHDEYAEVNVRVPNTGQEWHYRIETFESEESFSHDNAEQVFSNLQSYIKSYNEKWELIQILDTQVGSPYVHLVYREIK